MRATIQKQSPGSRRISDRDWVPSCPIVPGAVGLVENHREREISTVFLVEVFSCQGNTVLQCWHGDLTANHEEWWRPPQATSSISPDLCYARIPDNRRFQAVFGGCGVAALWQLYIRRDTELVWCLRCSSSMLLIFTVLSFNTHALKGSLIS